MEKNPTVLLVVLLISFAVAIGVASQFGGSQAASGSSKAAPAAAKKLRAKPGTQREKARALLGSTASLPSGETGSKGSQNKKPTEVWGHLAKSREEVQKSVAQRIAQEALSGSSANEGIERIRERLASGNDSAESAELFSAMGMLYARMKPIDLDVIREAFAMARSSAQTPEQRIEAIYREAKAFMALEQTELALQAMNGIPEDPGEAVSRRVELGILRGIAYESAGNRDKAVESYEAALRVAIESKESPYSDMAYAYRQGALRLSRLYRKEGDDPNADRVTREMQYWLGADVR